MWLNREWQFNHNQKKLRVIFNIFNHNLTSNNWCADEWPVGYLIGHIPPYSVLCDTLYIFKNMTCHRVLELKSPYSVAGFLVLI